MRVNYPLSLAKTLRSTRFSLAALLLTSVLVGLGSVTPASARSPDTPERSPSFRHSLVGSWLVTYDVPAFVVPIPILLSFGREGVVIETDSPAPTTVGSLGILILSNGHGAWAPTGRREFSYLYRKLLYRQDGSSFGTTRTTATGALSDDGEQWQATLVIEFLDNNGMVVLSAPGTARGHRIHLEP